ncbi:hypothetical protein RHSIM_Rhsim05G0091800 [Rhododendron simsii]|uniref:Uncharacterized protein n=1 Tax=Rhododendron simsii TaxID=118357 RepID=A0A834H1J4_RHOSS|nr:hypothetical protein RHSIM_Rhsim05G0091800 [Rhododendron simsii]
MLASLALIVLRMEQEEPAGAASQMQLLTESCSGTYSWIRWVHIHLLVTLVFSAQAVLSGKIVKFLPGYDGELPFKLETGYISVDASELFYYFVESEGNPQEDPLFLWLTGGPGCSSFSGLIYESGPMEFDFQNYTGGLPKLKNYPYRWTKAASMLYLDSPVGAGFSYARNPEGWHSSDTKSAEQSYQFLGKWMIEHPQFLSVQLFIGGDSYSGIPVPLITKKIIDGNKEKDKPYLNIKGYLVGSPWTDSSIDTNSKVEFAHRMALISDEIYENARRSCKENYVNVDPENAACLAALGDIQMCVKDVFDKDILKPNCDLFSPEIGEDLDRRSLEEGASEQKSLGQEYLVKESWLRKSTILHKSMLPRGFRLLYSSIWENDDSVQEALHVRKGTIRQWERCNDSLSYTEDVLSVVPVHIELSRSALEVLVERSDHDMSHAHRFNGLHFTPMFFGDHDMVVPYMGTLKWIKSLNLTLVDNWRPWFIDRQVAGWIHNEVFRSGISFDFCNREALIVLHMVQAAAAAAASQMQLLTESCSAQAVLSGMIVKFLPGYDGELPFKLETGYISVDNSELFYYFVESEGNPQEDPLFLWLTGGPGCTSFSGLIYEAEFVGGGSWRHPEVDWYHCGRVAQIIYGSRIAGVLVVILGSSAAHGGSWRRACLLSFGGFDPGLVHLCLGCWSAIWFLEGWGLLLLAWPMYPMGLAAASMIFLDSPVGTGFSYARNPEGWLSSDTKSAEHSYQFLRKWMIEHPQFLSVQLFIAGDSYAGIPIPLISKKIIDGNKDKDKDKLYLNIKGYLIGSPVTDSSIDTNSKVEFAHGMALISDEIYENARRSCKENYVNVDPENAACSAALGDIQMDFVLQHSSIWQNDDSVQEALHVRKGTIPHWKRCNNSILYTTDVVSVVSVHKELSRSALEVLVERYTMKYSDHGYRLTFAIVKGAGHPAPQFYRRERYYLFDRWVNYNPI